jgi:hypothetical protein
MLILHRILYEFILPKINPKGNLEREGVENCYKLAGVFCSA